MMTRRHLLLTTGFVATLPGAAASARATSAYDAALARVHGASSSPALGGMVVGPDGPVWSGTLGVRRAGASDKAASDDRWHLGSNTKAMTAALYGRLVDKGLARWGASLSTLLPDVDVHPAWSGTPIESVIGQTAGLLDETALGRSWLMTARADPRPLAEQRMNLARAMLAVPPAGAPGTFVYANSNYVLLGAIIEHLTGEVWEDVMRHQLFAPLGITSGGFGSPMDVSPWGHSAGLSVDPDSPGSDNPRAMGPAGTVHMSLVDYARFLRIFLNAGGGWLSRDSYAVLSGPLGQGASVYAGGWLVAEGRAWAGGPALTHDGSNTLWYVSTWVAPGVRRAFVAVANDAEAGRSACQALIPELIRAG